MMRRLRAPGHAPRWTALRLGGLALGGVLCSRSFAPVEWWWAAPLGIALALLAAGVSTTDATRDSSVPMDSLAPANSLSPAKSAGPRLRRAFLGGLVFGLGLTLPIYPWVGEFVGAAAWLGLSVTLSVFTGVAGLAVGLVYWALRARRGMQISWILAVPTVSIAVESLLSVWPFGGFPWSRLTFGQVGGPLVYLAAWGGEWLVSWTVVLTGTALAVLLARGAAALRHRQGNRATPRAVVVTTLIAAVCLSPLLGGLLAQRGVERRAASPSSEVTLAVVQGNVPEPGLDFNKTRFQVLTWHVEETERLAAEVAAGRAPQPDVVLWPENSSDVDPFRNSRARALIDRAVAAIKAPILVGTVIGRDDPSHPSERVPEARNVTLLWDSSGPTEEHHDKRFIQPFGEYLPFRNLIEPIIPLARRAGNFVPGTDSGVLAVPTPHAGDAEGHREVTTIGSAICYEVAFSPALTMATRDGAQLLAVPTNNATFGHTAMTYQQMAMSQLRAVEHNRSVVVAATTGTSGVIDARGTVLRRTALFVNDSFVERVPLYEGLTLSDHWGRLPEGTAAAAAVALGLLGAVRRSRAGKIGQ